jgi:hypothetical protein
MPHHELIIPAFSTRNISADRKIFGCLAVAKQLLNSFLFLFPSTELGEGLGVGVQNAD